MQAHDVLSTKNETEVVRPQTGWKGPTARILINGSLAIFAITAIFPFIWMIYNSMKTGAEFALDIFSLPSAIRLDSYIKIINTGTVFSALYSSFFNSIVSTVIIIGMAFVVAYFLARYRFRGRNLLYLFFLFGMLLPVPAMLIPVFVQFRAFQLLNTPFTLLFPYVGFGLPLAIFLTESYIRSIPTELEEAAFIDGATLPQMLRRIIFPICRPIIATVAILNFLNTWNEFPFALILVRSQYLRTIPLWLNTFRGEYSVNYPDLMAGMVIASLPVIIVYLIFHEQVVSGLVAGAVKS